RLHAKFQPDLPKTRQTATANTITAHHAHNHAQPKIAANICIETKFSKTQPIAPKLIAQPHPCKKRLSTNFQPSRLKNVQTATANSIIAHHAHNQAQPKIAANTCSVTKFFKTQPVELKLKPQPYPCKKRLRSKFQPSRLKNRQTAAANSIIANHAHNHAQPKMSVSTCTVAKNFKTQPIAPRLKPHPHPYQRRLHSKFQPSRLENVQTPTANSIIANHAHNQAQPKIAANTCTVPKFSKTKPTELKLKPQPYPHKQRLLCKFQLGLLKNHQTPTANIVIAHHAHNHAQPKIAANTCSVPNFFKTQPIELKLNTQPHPCKNPLPTKFQPDLAKTRQTATANTIIANHTHNQAQPKISANTCIETNFSKTQPIEPKLKPQPHPYKQRLPTKFQPNRAIFDRMPTANTIIARHAHNHAQPEMSASTCSVPNFFKS
ncbi:hypothetical protein BX667DRAFT_510689, partial [Coemansia mojavensis]